MKGPCGPLRRRATNDAPFHGTRFGPPTARKKRTRRPAVRRATRRAPGTFSGKAARGMLVVNERPCLRPGQRQEGQRLPTMSLLSAIRLALGALLVHKGRTALTSLGIVIGIAAVIALVAAGDGAWSKLDERLVSAGKNLIIVRPGARKGN